MSLGASIHHEQVREGSNVTFECHVRANPPILEIAWHFEGRPLTFSPIHKQGTIIRNHSLILKKVSRDQTGDYKCVSANVEGEGSSQDVHLKVLCKSVQIKIKKERSFFYQHIRTFGKKRSEPLIFVSREETCSLHCTISELSHCTLTTCE